MDALIGAGVARAASANGKLRPAIRGNRRRGVGLDGLSRNERDVLDMHDERIGAGDIAHALRLNPATVSRIIRTYAERPGEQAAAELQARMGSQALLRAQLRYGQHELPGPVAQALIVALRIRPPERGRA